MMLDLEVRRPGSLFVVLGVAATSACFNPDAPPLETDTSTQGSTTVDPATTTGPPPATDGSTSSVVTGSGSSSSGVDPDSSTTAMAESSSGDPPMAMCGDGVLDPGTETCDDGNRDSGDLCDATCQVETVSFLHTGGEQQLEVPAWVDSLVVEAWGAQGGGSPCCQPEPPQEDGGRGGYVTGVLPTVGGLTLIINVGGQGIMEGPGGYNGGGAGGTWAGGGGGASDIRVAPAMLDNRLMVAAGGGGGNCGCPDFGIGGDGGGLMGAPGIALQGGQPPGGGTQEAGGAAGQMGSPGTLGQGGSTADGDLYHVAGGGGGYYGGGGGETVGGGGGSSYLGLLEDAMTLPGEREGHGEIQLTPVAAQ